MYNLIYDQKFQNTTGYLQECDLLFRDFLDALRHVRNIVLMLYPSEKQIRFSGAFDDYGNFRIVIRHQFRASVATIYHQ